MAAMMPSGGVSGGGQAGNPYEHYNSPRVEDDTIDPDDGNTTFTTFIFWQLSI